MSITIEIEPPIEAALRMKASEAGLTFEAYISQLLVSKADLGINGFHPKVAQSLERLEKFGGKLGPIPDGALDPELLYDNR